MDLETHYLTGPAEDTRLARTPHGRLEFLRTRELLRRFLPGRSRVLDVGGGTGVHAAWLAADGHRVHLVDVVPAHVAEAAALPGVTASKPAMPGTSPPATRRKTWFCSWVRCTTSSSRRPRSRAVRGVAGPAPGWPARGGGDQPLPLPAGNRCGRHAHVRSRRPVRAVIETGAYDGHVGFVPTHWHTATELHDEVTTAGFTDTAVFGVEGPSWPALDAAGLARFDQLVEPALRAARIVERDPALIGASAHLLAVARRPA